MYFEIQYVHAMHSYLSIDGTKNVLKIGFVGDVQLVQINVCEIGKVQVLKKLHCLTATAVQSATGVQIRVAKVVTVPNDLLTQ